jgi:hypothetical protein
MQAYHESVRDWAEILLERVQPVPGHPRWAYYGRGGHGEDDVRPIAYAALVHAFLSEARPPGRALDPQRRARMRNDAVAALRYLTRSHVSGGGACLDGKPWGDQWQSAMWARAAGMAGWLLWPRLDDELKAAVARLVEHEADRFIRRRPKSSEFRDTGAEENAWNAAIVALAANMMPRHPRAPAWAAAAKRYMYNALSVAADHKDQSPGDDGRPVRHWVTTVNAHPDFTVENHGLVHVGYLKTTVAMLLENAVHYLAADQPVPHACLHHVPEALDVLLKCMSWSGAPIYFGGNDWKTVHTQATDIVIYAMASTLTGDRRAAHLEDVALEWLRRIQRQHRGYYNVRRDLEFGGLCATRLIACYLAHAARGQGAEPVAEAEFDRRVSGTTHLEHAPAILHRTPTKFASFSWGRQRLALALPRGGNCVLWPHVASYVGLLNGQAPSARLAKLTRLHHDVQPRSFSVTGSLARLGGKVVHDFAYASLARDATVYVERLTVVPGFRLASRESGIVGHEYAPGTNERTLTGRHGTTRVVGTGGTSAVHEIDTDWLNLGGRVGYVVRRLPGRRNLMRYHDAPRGKGRVPKLQEWISLVGERDPAAWAATGDWACVVTFLNQSPRETAASAERVTLEIQGGRATCRIGRDTVEVDFAHKRARITEPASP